MPERLRRTRDVRAALSQGRAVHGAHAVMRGRRRGEDTPARWTVSASRRVGSAVRRNRAKRRLRAVLRQMELPSGVDLVVIARESAVSAPFAELVEDVAGLVGQLGVREGAGGSR